MKTLKALDDLISRIIKTPQTSIPGTVAVCSVLWPQYTAQITAIATGVGLMLAADGLKQAKPEP